VLEDDAILDGDFERKAREAIRAAPAGWDCIHLSTNFKRSPFPVADLGSNHCLVRYMRLPVNSVAYVISLAGAQKLMAPRYRVRPFDVEFRLAWESGLEMLGTFPAIAQVNGLEGVRRLIHYQSVPYAWLYLSRLRPMIEADQLMGAQGRLLKEVARHLAVRMSYEDVVRVAQAKIAPARMQRIAQEELRVNGEPFSVHDFLKPGIEELCQLLPPFMARRILRLAERKGWLGRVYFGMEINSTSISGYLRFLMLAKLRPLRPHGHRFKQEQQQIDSWLALVREGARHSAGLALEIADCARLIKGYGDTHARGLANYRTIEDRVIRPALAGQIPAAQAADAVANARTAALLDPEGEGLARCLADIGGQTALRVAAE